MANRFKARIRGLGNTMQSIFTTRRKLRGLGWSGDRKKGEGLEYRKCRMFLVGEMMHSKANT